MKTYRPKYGHIVWEENSKIRAFCLAMDTGLGKHVHKGKTNAIVKKL